MPEMGCSPSSTPNAEVSCGAFNAEVMRCAYWDARRGLDDIDRTYEVRINGLPEDGAGMDQVPGGQ